MYDMIIVGAGTAGLTAGIYALRSGVKPLILECEAMGGQITLSPCVENYPGIAKISGMEFADGLMAQLTNLGGEVTYGRVISARKIDNGFEVCTEDGETYEGKNLIIASGAAHRHLGIEREQELIGRGVSYCAVKSLIDQVMVAENIECVMESRVTALIGEKKLTELEVTNLSGEKKTLVADGLFVAIGMEPHNEVFRDLVDLDEAGYVIAGENCKTRTPGVYAAGDCRTKTVRQLTTAAADGTVCGLVCKAV